MYPLDAAKAQPTVAPPGKPLPEHGTAAARALGSLDHKLQQAEKMMSRVREVLDPVLIPPLDRAEPPVPGGAPVAPLIEVIRKCEARLDAIIAIGEDILERTVLYPG